MRTIRETFDDMDTDGSGSIRESELREAMRQMGMGSPSQAEYDELMREMDLDGNGELDFGEFTAMIGTFYQIGSSTPRIPLHAIRRAFDDIDTDGSGSIRESELRVAMRRMGMGDPSQAEYELLMREADIDSDGELDFNEFAFLFAAMGTLHRNVEAKEEAVNSSPPIQKPDEKVKVEIQTGLKVEILSRSTQTWVPGEITEVGGNEDAAYIRVTYGGRSRGINLRDANLLTYFRLAETEAAVEAKPHPLTQSDSRRDQIRQWAAVEIYSSDGWESAKVEKVMDDGKHMNIGYKGISRVINLDDENLEQYFRPKYTDREKSSMVTVTFVDPGPVNIALASPTDSDGYGWPATLEAVLPGSVVSHNERIQAGMLLITIQAGDGEKMSCFGWSFASLYSTLGNISNRPLKLTFFDSDKNVQLRSFRKAFDAIDTDGSGSIREAELREAMRQMGMADPSQAEYNELLREVDIDGNGELDFGEFAAMMEAAEAVASRPKATSAVWDSVPDSVYSAVDSRHSSMSHMQKLDETTTAGDTSMTDEGECADFEIGDAIFIFSRSAKDWTAGEVVGTATTHTGRFIQIRYGLDKWRMSTRVVNLDDPTLATYFQPKITECVTITFEQPGSLGVVLKATPPGSGRSLWPAMLDTVMPHSPVASDTRLKIGMAISGVQAGQNENISVFGWSYEKLFDLLTHGAGRERPLALTFFQPVRLRNAVIKPAPVSHGLASSIPAAIKDRLAFTRSITPRSASKRSARAPQATSSLRSNKFHRQLAPVMHATSAIDHMQASVTSQQTVGSQQTLPWQSTNSAHPLPGQRLLGPAKLYDKSPPKYPRSLSQTTNIQSVGAPAHFAQRGKSWSTMSEFHGVPPTSYELSTDYVNRVQSAIVADRMNGHVQHMTEVPMKPHVNSPVAYRLNADQKSQYIFSDEQLMDPALLFASLSSPDNGWASVDNGQPEPLSRPLSPKLFDLSPSSRSSPRAHSDLGSRSPDDQFLRSVPEPLTDTDSDTVPPDNTDNSQMAVGDTVRVYVKGSWLKGKVLSSLHPTKITVIYAKGGLRHEVKLARKYVRPLPVTMLGPP